MVGLWYVNAPTARVALLLLPLVAACEDGAGSSGPLDPGAADPPGDPVAGAAAFVADCAGCHASGDGFDLAFFSFPDTTILRRAEPHVDATTAEDIAAYLATLAVDPVPRGTRPFQPGGVVLVDDLSFAFDLFGVDAWPAGWSTAELLAVDPTKIRVAVPLPQWSDESTNLDWMPDDPLTDGILDNRDGLARFALERYYASRSTAAAVDAVRALRLADRDPTSAVAPCGRDDLDVPLLDGNGCFETRRWTASLAAQHLLRGDVDGAVDPALHDAWWDVGNAARLAVRDGLDLERAVENWAAWMYLGWMFAPDRHATVYTGNGLRRIGLPRHATFVALRSQVARAEGSFAPYPDLANAARFAPIHWAYEATTFGYRHLLDRLATGDRPPEERLEEARTDVALAWEVASRKVRPDQAVELALLRDRVLAALD